MSFTTAIKHSYSTNGSTEPSNGNKPPSPIKGNLTPVVQTRALQALTKESSSRSSSPVNGMKTIVVVSTATAAHITTSLESAQITFKNTQEAFRKAQTALLDQLLEQEPRSKLTSTQLARHDQLFTRQHQVESNFITLLELAAFLQNKLQQAKTFDKLSWGEMSSAFVDNGLRNCSVIDINIQLKQAPKGIEQLIEDFLINEAKVSKDKVKTLYSAELVKTILEITISGIKLSFVAK